MKAVLQRVTQATVFADGEFSGKCEHGLMILLGVAPYDTVEDAIYLAERCATLRIFHDENGKMNRSLLDINGEALIVSQFTLYADTSGGHRPSFANAAKGDIAAPLYLKFVEAVKAWGINVGTGVFGADMDLEIHNQGPVTVTVKSKSEKKN
jgi:D-tyrosyl-tRNA(Tyr) deacylase